MTELLRLNTDSDDLNTMHQQFKDDVCAGLSKIKKSIPSTYLYDATGCKLFNQLTRHPDYYLTQCEVEILTTYRKQIADYLHQQSINLIEFGPGEGIKTHLLLEQLLQDGGDFTYTPIDISENYLLELAHKIEEVFPELVIKAIQSDYLSGLTWLRECSKQRKCVLFLGSSIGNLDLFATHKFLQNLWQALNHEDYVLIGFDLRKDIEIMVRAYNDSDGITRNFNLNLLQRMNSELGANFAVDKFSHYEMYNIYSGAMESYIVSGETQTVAIDALQQSFTFQAFEGIHVEYSYKYLLSQIEEFARASGFTIVHHFMDPKQYFVDSLWQVQKSPDLGRR